MTYLSVFEKFKILFDILMDFEFVLIFTLLILMFTILYCIKRLSSKKYILYIALSFILLFGISIVNNYDILSNTFDDFTTIFFGNIYFPSIYVYIGVLVISFIAFITSILNIMLKKIYKIINSIMFVLNNVLFVIILNIIAENKIDIFSVNSLYTDTNLVVLLELSMGLCILWILSLLVVYITNVLYDRIVNKKVYNKEVKMKVFNPILEVSNDEGINVNNTDDVIEGKLPNKELIVENIINKENKLMISESANIKEEKEDNKVTFNDILNGCIPVTYYDNSAVTEEYNLINPQTIYEDNYNKIKKEISFNDLNIVLNNEIEVNTTDNIDTKKEEILDNNYELSVEELTLKKKNKISEERLSINTISLNDLIDETIDIQEEINENNEYSIDDYKKIANMLNSLKEHSNDINIKIDDAVAISLIKNYSVDDCLKFKNILENNLN